MQRRANWLLTRNCSSTNTETPPLPFGHTFVVQERRQDKRRQGKGRHPFDACFA